MSTNRDKRLEQIRNIEARRADDFNLLSSGSSKSIGSGDRVRNNIAQTLFKDVADGSGKSRFRFDRDKIAGKYDDLRADFNAAIKRKGGPSVEEMMKIRQIHGARERSFMSRWLGKGKDNHLLRGGGTSNVYMFGAHEAFSVAGVGDHLSRAAKFARGYGMTDDIMNSLGMLTKHQKNIISSSSQGLGQKLMAGAPAAIGGIFAVAEVTPYLNGEKESTLSDNAGVALAGLAASMASFTYGFRVTKELTHATTSLIPKFSKQGEALGALSKARGYAKWGIGAGMGLAGGLGLSLLVDKGFELFKASASTDNAINRVKAKLYVGDTVGDTSVMTSQLATGRQRAVQKLSKSALNDRGSILGNEAMILKGIY